MKGQRGLLHAHDADWTYLEHDISALWLDPQNHQPWDGRSAFVSVEELSRLVTEPGDPGNLRILFVPYWKSPPQGCNKAFCSLTFQDLVLWRDVAQRRL
jgi:hypothetical protein